MSPLGNHARAPGFFIHESRTHIFRLLLNRLFYHLKLVINFMFVNKPGRGIEPLPKILQIPILPLYDPVEKNIIAILIQQKNNQHGINAKRVAK